MREYINCEPEVLLEMIADADWGPVIIRVQIKKDIFIHIICLIIIILSMHIISACFATAGFAGVWKYNKIGI